LALYDLPPSIRITGTNHPYSVRLTWGGGFIGRCGFEIGFSNFLSEERNARAWQPGVYFWSEHPQN